MAIYKSNKATKDGRQYFFRIKYKDIFGITKDYTSPKYKTKAEAVSEEAMYRLKMSLKQNTTSSISFGEVAQEYILSKQTQVKKQTMHKYIYLMDHLTALKKIKVNDIDLNKYNVIKDYINSLNFSVGYKNKILGFFKSVIEYSSKYYNTSESIVKFIEPFKDKSSLKKEMNFFTYDEYRQFDSVIDDHIYHTLFEILYFLGLRQGELQALTWNDIDLQNKKININKTLTTKIKGEKYTISSPKTKNSIRILPITENVLNDLKIMNKEAKKYKDYSNKWFVFGNTLPIAESTIQKRKNNYCLEAGVKQIRIHDFRHSCASLLINKGASIALVSKYLGHSNVSITLDTYTHMFKSELENMTKILDNL